MDQKANILLVEDDMNLGFVIQDNLKMNGFQVHLSQDGKEGLKAFAEGSYNLCLLDVMMPKKDGFSLAEDIRKIDTEVPIIFLSAKTMTEDKVKGFKVGADDYITKPFSTDELILRIEAILKRTMKSGTSDDNTFQLGSYVYDVSNYLLKHPSEDKKTDKKRS